MIKSFINFHREMLEDDMYCGKFLFTLFMLIYLVVGILLFILIDSTGGETTTKQGTVYSKEFVPAHTRTRMVGKIVTTESIPDEWFIKVELGYDTYTNCKVPYTKYTSLNKRDEVTVTVSEGFFTGNYYCEYL